MEENFKSDHQYFMLHYVKRINQSTFNVSISGVRIGSAKYSRLAQINLRTKIITFSRFAVTDVPERGRRYLVLHELAHVLEPSHNKRFWQLVGQFEPDYKRIDKELEDAFRKNVLSHLREARNSGRKSQQYSSDLVKQLTIDSQLKHYLRDDASQEDEIESEVEPQLSDDWDLYENSTFTAGVLTGGSD
jgi:hypothetical protein